MLALLRSRGGRVTTPRRAILSALLEADHHVTADDLTAAVQRDHPEIHQSTVYRTLETLTELGVVDHVHLGHGGAVFHLAHERHQHLLCSSCGRVTEAPEDVVADLARQLDDRYGFALEARHFALTGRCARCREDGDGRHVAADTPWGYPAHMTTQTFSVQGMTCDHCVKAVTDELQKIDGVTGVDVVLETGSVTVASNEGVDDDQVRAAVDEAGYEVV